MPSPRLGGVRPGRHTELPLNNVGTVAYTPHGGEPSSNCFRSGSHRQRGQELLAQPSNGQTSSGQPGPSLGDLHPAGNLELVTTERYSTHGYATAERLLGDPQSTVRHHADRAVEDRRERYELLGGGGGHHPRAPA